MPGEGSYILLKAFQQLCAPPGLKVSAGWQPAMYIQDFEHGGTTMSGLASDVDIRAGKEILAFPAKARVTDESLRQDRFLGCGSDPSAKMACGYAKHGLWLAEKKLEVLGSDADDQRSWLPRWFRHRLVETGNAEKDYWSAWIHGLPKYEDYERLGLPLTAAPAELAKLKGLPKFGSVPEWTSEMKETLTKELAHYNARRGDRPEISWKDAMWGLIAAFTRSFDCGGEGHMTMAPIGDMVNHSSTPNVVYYCEHDMLKFTTRQRVKAGEELLAVYHPPKDGSVTLLSQYGILDDASDASSWSNSDCQQLQDAHLDKSESPYLQNVVKLVNANCPAPARPKPAPGLVEAKVVGQVEAIASTPSCRQLRLRRFRKFRDFL